MDLYNFDFSRKILFHPEKIVAYKNGERPFPTTIEIDLTNRCNHRCKFCFSDKSELEKKQALDADILKQRLFEARELGTRGVSFTGGGEPMMHPRFLEIVDHARALGLDVGLITNGSLLSEKNCAELVRQLTWIRISVSGGDRASYLDVQGVDHLEAVVANIRSLDQCNQNAGGRLNIGVRTIVTPQNLPALGCFSELLGGTKIDYLQVAPDQLSSDGGAFWESAAVRQACDELKHGLARDDIKLLATGFMLDQPRIHYPRTCYAHFFMCAILADGSLTFCKNCRGVDSYYIGNIEDQTLAQIWAGEGTGAIEAWVRPDNCGLFCKHLAINCAMEEILHPVAAMTPNFVG